MLNFLDTDLYERQRYDEKELKDAIMDNVQNFLMELDTGLMMTLFEHRFFGKDSAKWKEAISRKKWQLS